MRIRAITHSRFLEPTVLHQLCSRQTVSDCLKLLWPRLYERTQEWSSPGAAAAAGAGPAAGSPGPAVPGPGGAA